ncbi:MAG TPA: MFS transporter [Clostridia bacterium]|jgi:fucose permease|nr:MFS transporter [Clostridia bacterium]
MYSLLLALIYLAFISLGLPDSLLGSAWPVMQPQLGVPMSYAGIITMIVSMGTIISSLMSDRLTKKLGAGLVTAVSVCLTAVALLGFSLSSKYWMLCLWAIPYGLGAGGVDAALNNYVALHYASRHMNWLHCFWGVGALISPYIMSYALTNGMGWNNGYRIVFYIQIALSAVLFISLPMWKRKGGNKEEDPVKAKPLKIKDAVRIKGVAPLLITFFAYCSLEQTTGIWASSYLVKFRGIDANIAAQFASLFFIGITAGRAICGFISDKVGDKLLIRVGISVVFVGIILIAIPVNACALAGLVTVGVGCAPIYPAVIHATPNNFGKENSQAIIGIQMASAYVGTTFMPLLFGVIADNINIGLYPVYLFVLAVLMIVMSETVNRIVSRKSAIAE